MHHLVGHQNVVKARKVIHYSEEKSRVVNFEF
jgi:hypothetical protein